MKRRDFLKTSSLAVAGAASLPSVGKTAAAPAGDPPAREFYELRIYHLRRGPKQRLFDDFYRQAMIPAMNRIGITPVGVFSVMTGPDSPSIYVLLPHKTIASVATAIDRR